MRPRVLIVDDHAGFRLLARTSLEAAGGTVAGEAATAAEALRLLATISPDVVLLDIRLPDADGFAVCRAIRALRPAVRVVLCSVHPVADYGPAYAECGADGFVPKDEFTADRVMRGPGGVAGT
ncbi:response regulator [Dactylosporangium sp. CS-047395]|uniref:response regulator n=1 Tax=Dactylosporangium sp. CS-047395 TaxID=3239936 RepID=UPI003D94AEEB